MKPTKNRVFCKECGRTKMLFETEKKAQLFMKFNNEDIAAENDNVPVRAYFCESCGGWHLTHIVEAPKGVSKTQQAIDHMNVLKETRKTQKQKLAEIRIETSNTINSQLSEVDKHIAEEAWVRIEGKEMHLLQMHNYSYP